MRRKNKFPVEITGFREIIIHVSPPPPFCANMVRGVGVDLELCNWNISIFSQLCFVS